MARFWRLAGILSGRENICAVVQYHEAQARFRRPANLQGKESNGGGGDHSSRPKTHPPEICNGKANQGRLTDVGEPSRKSKIKQRCTALVVFMAALIWPHRETGVSVCHAVGYYKLPLNLVHQKICGAI